MQAGTGLRLDEHKLDVLDEIARAQHNTRSGIIRLAIDNFIDAYRRSRSRRVSETELPLVNMVDRLSTSDEPEQRAAEEPV